MTAVAKSNVIPIRRAEATSASRASEAPASPETTLSDESVLAACATFDPGALALLYDRHAHTVTRFLSRMTYVDRQEIQDLVHDTFLQALRSASSFRRGSSVRTWLFAVAANVARQASRASRRRRSLTEAYPAAAPAPASRSPEVELERQESLRRAADALLALPHDTRVAFVMCDLEDVPGVEAARVLHVPTGTLYRRLHEARCALRRAIDGADG